MSDSERFRGIGDIVKSALRGVALLMTSNEGLTERGSSRDNVVDIALIADGATSEGCKILKDR